jgi:REP element-mobilizing transposase RayT
MARKLRVEYPGAIYHVVNRGDRREEIFRDDGDRQWFLTTLGEACGKTDWQVHALCLMPNHFHLVLETPQPNLVVGMKWFLGNYTARFNRRHRLCGHVFSGRYKALVVGASSSGYLKTVCDYVHLNPARARLLKPEEALRTYRWSSWPEYMKSPRRRWPWLRVDRLLGEYHIPRDSAAGRRRLEQALEARRDAGENDEFRAIRRGWFFGEEQMKKELLASVSEKVGQYHYGEAVHDSAEGKADRIVSEELQRRNWTEATLAERRKGDGEKVKMAMRLRRETTMTVAWIAKRLRMGTPSHLTHLLYWHGRRGDRKA